MSDKRLANDRISSDRSLLEDHAEEWVPAWERLEAGRYMPRRIRGSFRGRALG
jgi:hypothetical protein